MRRGLTDMHEDLSRDLDDAGRARLDVVIDGSPVFGHEVRIDALSKLLHSLQESVTSIAQALTGRATARAAIPGPLREATSLRLAAVFPGSFGAMLKGPLAGSGENRFSSSRLRRYFDQAVDWVLSIIEMAGGPEADDDPIVAAVLPLGSRAFKHFSDLSSAIVDEQMTATLAWLKPGAEPREVHLTQAAARRLDDVLGRNKLSEREVVVTGRLGTVSDIRNRVEFADGHGVDHFCEGDRGDRAGTGRVLHSRCDRHIPGDHDPPASHWR